MAEPKWLAEDLILAIHDEQLAMFGGGTGIRDRGLLESALARPVNRFHYEPEASLFNLAAALGSGIIGNHPFIDGNKRTGLMAIRAFLRLNGWNFEPQQADEVAMILGLAAGEVDEPELARWIEANTKKA